MTGRRLITAARACVLHTPTHTPERHTPTGAPPSRQTEPSGASSRGHAPVAGLHSTWPVWFSFLQSLEAQTGLAHRSAGQHGATAEVGKRPRPCMQQQQQQHQEQHHRQQRQRLQRTLGRAALADCVKSAQQRGCAKQLAAARRVARAREPAAAACDAAVGACKRPAARRAMSASAICDWDIASARGCEHSQVFGAHSVPAHTKLHLSARRAPGSAAVVSNVES